MDIREMGIDGEYFADLHDKTARNADLAVFYDHLLEETDDLAFFNRGKAMRLCCQWWDTEYYRLQQVKDIKRVNLCRDKFCFNCQTMLALKRQQKYAPMLDMLYNDFSICHMVVTVPNVGGDELLPTLEKMYKKFKYLTRYLSGNKHVRGVDFVKYGYAGGLRALEVTQNASDGLFHPHFHVMLLLRKGITFERKYINHYSFDGHNLVRKFSELEITLQKVWYLLMNGKTVIKEKLEELSEGYSIIIDTIAKGEYHEVFKYACKGAFKDGSVYDENTFRALFYSLHGRRMIQGYGALHNFKDEQGQILESDLEQNYEEMIAQLRSIEEPCFKVESLQEIMNEKNCAYVSKSNLKRLLIARRRQEEAEEAGEADDPNTAGAGVELPPQYREKKESLNERTSSEATELEGGKKPLPTNRRKTA